MTGIVLIGQLADICFWDAQTVITDYPDQVLIDNMQFNVNLNVPESQRANAHVMVRSGLSTSCNGRRVKLTSCSHVCRATAGARTSNRCSTASPQRTSALTQSSSLISYVLLLVALHPVSWT